MFGWKSGVALVSILVTLSLSSPKTINALVNPSIAKEKTAIGERCNLVTEKVGNRILTWEASETEKKRLYNNIVERVQKMVIKLKKENYDTSELEASLRVLNESMLKRHDDAKTLVNLLKDTQSYACGTSEGKYLESLKAAREQWTVFHQDTLDIKNIWQNEVRPSIRELKIQKVNISATPGTAAN